MGKRFFANIGKKIYIIDGAMGTELQKKDIEDEVWNGAVGCNEILNRYARSVIKDIHISYIESGADIIKTNSFGALPWVLDEYGMGEDSYELSRLSAEIAKDAIKDLGINNRDIFVAGSIGPGTKLPTLGHIDYDSMFEGYCE